MKGLRDFPKVTQRQNSRTVKVYRITSSSLSIIKHGSLNAFFITNHEHSAWYVHSRCLCNEWFQANTNGSLYNWVWLHSFNKDLLDSCYFPSPKQWPGDSMVMTARQMPLPAQSLHSIPRLVPYRLFYAGFSVLSLGNREWECSI